MQNPAFWARLGLLWCVFIFVACWCASANAATPADSGGGEHRAGVAAVAAPATGTTATASRRQTLFAVANSQSSSAGPVVTEGIAAHAVPALNGFGLFVLATLLGFAALWVWRRRQ